MTQSLAIDGKWHGLNLVCPPTSIVDPSLYRVLTKSFYCLRAGTAHLELVSSLFPYEQASGFYLQMLPPIRHATDTILCISRLLFEASTASLLL